MPKWNWGKFPTSAALWKNTAVGAPGFLWQLQQRPPWLSSNTNLLHHMSAYRVRVWLKAMEHPLVNLCQKRLNSSSAVTLNTFGRAGGASSRLPLQELLSWSVTDLTKNHFLCSNLQDEESRDYPCNDWLQDPILFVMIHTLHGFWFVLSEFIIFLYFIFYLFLFHIFIF